MLKIFLKPPWLNKKIDYKAMHRVEESLSGLSVHTVCHQAKCPNISECFQRGTATFLIMGDTCTRNCGFCNVRHGSPGPPLPDEPERILEAVKRLNLRYAVITSVTRDDLDDGGASEFASVIKKIKSGSKATGVEILTPDFMGRKSSVAIILAEKPDVFAHNVETVPSVYRIRPGADYYRSLSVLETAKKISSDIHTKSALMLGLGETESEIISVMRDLRSVGCDFLSIGQYLRPGKNNCPVKKYVSPPEFVHYKKLALEMGFRHVESGVYVRSSYMAETYL